MAKVKPRRGRPPNGRALTAAERMQRYRARKRAAGLRVATQWQPALPPQLGSGALKHRIIEARSLAMHCLMAQKIAANPALLEVARRNLKSWRSRYGDAPPPALDEWSEILRRPWPEVAAVMTDTTESGARLRQSSPFAGVLTQVERKRVYAAFRS